MWLNSNLTWTWSGGLAVVAADGDNDACGHLCSAYAYSLFKLYGGTEAKNVTQLLTVKSVHPVVHAINIILIIFKCCSLQLRDTA